MTKNFPFSVENLLVGEITEKRILQNVVESSRSVEEDSPYDWFKIEMIDGNVFSATYSRSRKDYTPSKVFDIAVRNAVDFYTRMQKSFKTYEPMNMKVWRTSDWKAFIDQQFDKDDCKENKALLESIKQYQFATENTESGEPRAVFKITFVDDQERVFTKDGALFDCDFVVESIKSLFDSMSLGEVKKIKQSLKHNNGVNPFACLNLEKTEEEDDEECEED